MLLAGGTLVAQDPRTLPRLQAADVVKVGTFRLPLEVGLPNALAIDGTTRYVGCYLRNPNPQRDSIAGVAKLLLPELGEEATLVEPCQPLPNRNHLHRSSVYENVIPGGILPWLGRLVVSGSDYYDGSGGQWKSHWAGANLSTLAGPFTVSVPDLPKFSDGQPPTVFWDRSAFVSGFMGVIPSAWRGLLGGPALTGNCCLPIISRISYGPSVSVFDPAGVGVVDPVPSKMLVGYPIEHRTLGGGRQGSVGAGAVREVDPAGDADRRRDQPAARGHLRRRDAPAVRRQHRRGRRSRLRHWRWRGPAAVTFVD